jgi:hypothetical protein
VGEGIERLWKSRKGRSRVLVIVMVLIAEILEEEL